MKKSTSIDLKARVDEAFRGYRETVAMVRDLIKRRQYPQEIILLVCARIDALSHLRDSPDGDRARFVNFLARYSHLGKQVRQISVPDLYDELCRWWWTLGGFIQLPGRIHLFNPFKDDLFLQFASESAGPITEKDIGRELAFITRTLKEAYRVVPGQHRAKPMLTSPEDLAATFKSGSTARPEWRAKGVIALQKLVRDFSIGALLYTNYRCGVIHEYKVEIDDEGFFTGTDVGWRSVFYPWDTISRRLCIAFPAAVLLRLLESSVENYIGELLHKKKLPAAIFFEIFHPLSDLEFLDVDSLGRGRDARLVK